MAYVSCFPRGGVWQALNPKARCPCKCPVHPVASKAEWKVRLFVGVRSLLLLLYFTHSLA